jgi:hypothetical protein
MLKKCIVIMVMFALVAGVAFAQITFGGQLQEGMDLFSGTNVTDDKVIMGGHYHPEGPYHEAKFSVLFGDGTAGGRLVWMLDEQVMWGWMQWRPSQYFRVKIGSDYDGEGGFPQIIGWGFTGEAKNSVAAVNDYSGGGLPMSYRNSGLNYGGFDGYPSSDKMVHLQLSVFPIDMLQINLLFRDIDLQKEVAERLATLQLYASYKIEEIGTVRFAAVGGGGLWEDSANGTSIGTLHLAFYSNEIVQGLAFELGGQYSLPKKSADGFDGGFDAIRIGGGINMTLTDPFNFKLRFGTMFGGQKADGSDIEKFGMSVGLLPSYKLPKMTIFLHVGFGLEQETKDDDAVYEWFINPYIWVPMGGMRMWVGLQIQDQHSLNDGQFKWAIPFGFNFYF